MATTTQVPVESYLSSADFEPDAEYVDGEIEFRPMGEYDHASWQQAIQLWFQEHAYAWNIRVRPELRVQVRPDNYRVPDVVVFDRSLPIEQILTHPPIAVFEVLSPEDSTQRLLRKLLDYERMGIRSIVVIDPKSDTIFQFANGSLQRLDQPVLELAASPCSVDWEQVRRYLED